MAINYHVVILSCCALSSNALLRASSSTFSGLASNYTFASYKQRYGRTYPGGGEEHRMREALFEKRLAEVDAHNARGLSWKMGINHLTDRTHEELQALNGHRPQVRSKSFVSYNFLQVERRDHSCSLESHSCVTSSCCSGLTCGAEGHCVPTKTASAFDWSSELSTAHKIVEQGSCGSCWAVAATAALNLHAEIVSGKRFKNVLSPQSILSCTPNTLECGGQGGCKGATAEVAYEWLKSRGSLGGVHTLDQQPYTATDDVCSASASQESPIPAVGIKGWKKLSENSAQEMMNTLVTVGPLVASIAANALFGYSSGVIDSCSDNVVNHAVVLMGYGEDQALGMHYWNVRNSWSQTWGENGFFRLKRAAPESEERCGWDEKPEEGVVCKDKEHGKYPTRQWVCGECAFLIDTAYPIGTHVPEEMLHETVADIAGSSDVQVEALHDNSWCKTQCQHFGMKKLSEIFGGVDFGNDPGSCVQTCDERVPPKAATLTSSLKQSVASFARALRR